MPPSPIVLAVDAGSTSAKAQCFDAAGRALGPAVRSPVAIGADGTADPARFVASVETAVDEALRRWTDPVDAVALSCAWHGLVGLGADGAPTTPLSTWSATGPNVLAGAVELRRRLEAGNIEAVRRRTGAPVHPSFPAARLLAEGVRNPEAFAATARWCSVGELLESRWLAGSPGSSSSMASATGLFDQEMGTWDGEVLLAIGLRPETLPPIDDSPRRTLAEPYRDRWPALGTAIWWPAIGDGAAAVVGTGCLDGGRAALTVGTSAAVRVLATGAERATRPAGLFAYLLDPDQVVLGAARSNAGNLLPWLSATLKVEGDLLTEVVSRPPGAHGLEAIPSLAGERSPDWPVISSGSVGGIHLDTTPLDIAQVFLEAAACGLAAAVDSLEAAVAADGRSLRLIGSGRAIVSSPAWRQLIADATGRPLIPSRVEEASARGAALVALDGLGWRHFAPDEDLDGDPVTPDPERAAAFAGLRAR